MRNKSISSFKKKLWKIFSEYIRLKYSTKDGYCRCCTCGDIKFYSEMQAGHFIDGRSNSILFEEKGVHPQCFRCNIMFNGNKVEYYKFMQNKYGEEVIDYLRELKNKTVKYTISDYERMIDFYSKALKALKGVINDRCVNGVYEEKEQKAS